MSDKVTLQSVAESFSRACGVPKKVAEQLARAFFDTVVDGLSNDESVKIDGLGTFRVVEVASRESINVTNGERIVIAGYKKVNFIPEDGLLVSNLVSDMPDVREDVVADDEETDVSNDTDETDIEETSEVDDETEDVSEDITTSEDEEPIDAVEAEVNMVEVPEKVEVQEDEFSGIDMLICTPESVEEIRLELEQARADAERKLIAAKEAHREVLRLEALLDKMEKSMVPECAEEEQTPETEAEPVPAMVAESVAKENLTIYEDIPSVAKEESAVETADEGQKAEEVAQTPVEPVEESLETVETPSVVETAEDENVTVNLEATTEEPSSEQEESTDVAPAEEDTKSAAEEAVQSTDAEVKQEDVTAEGAEENKDAQAEALNRLLSDKSAATPEPVRKKKDDGHYWIWILTPILVILIFGVSVVMYKAHSDKEKTELKQLPVEPKNHATPVKKQAPVVKPKVETDSIQSNTNVPAETTATEPAKSKAADNKSTAKPKTYILQRDETLTKVSRKFYGTKDSVRAIIRANKFKDPDNVPYGTEVILP
ncbi:MAG: HU family DNA-binding protein [Bacteroidaceae bacterium]|nr:HU family DNA-binding protein [Bacteroidaceae bacterium]